MLSLNSCVLCEYPITDPVCKGCYVKQTLILLNDLKVNPIICSFIYDRLKNISNLETLNDIDCILCRNDNVNICRYCFSVALMDLLRELNFTEDLIENFEYNIRGEEISLENEGIFNNEIELEKEGEIACI